MSKQVYETAPSYPYKDFITGTEIGPFVDTGRTVRFDRSEAGRVYLAKSTVAELAADLGIVGDPQERERAIAEAYNRGKLDAVLEGLDGNLAAVLRALADAADERLDHLLALGASADSL